MKKVYLVAAGLLFFLASCNETKNEQVSSSSDKKITNETVLYTSDTVSMKGFVSYDANIQGKRPVVLIIHEWWGQNDYVRGRARQLAELGYLAMAVDMYGQGKTADDPDAAGKAAMPFYMNPALAKARFDAALAKIKTYPEADTTRIAAIGYCFGGSMALNMARLGENLKGVVSFHGGLQGPPTSKELLKATMLVCHGEDDSFVKPEEVAAFKKEMDSLGVSYIFKSYPGATHAFSNPEATEKGKKFNLPIAYNAAADTASFNEMKEFFKGIF